MSDDSLKKLVDKSNFYSLQSTAAPFLFRKFVFYYYYGAVSHKPLQAIRLLFYLMYKHNQIKQQQNGNQKVLSFSYYLLPPTDYMHYALQKKTDRYSFGEETLVSFHVSADIVYHTTDVQLCIEHNECGLKPSYVCVEFYRKYRQAVCG